MRNVVGGMGVAVHCKHTGALSALARGWSTPIGAKGGLRWLGGRSSLLGRAGGVIK